MQKIYCDKKVIHPDTGVKYYRVQGTDGWVFDRRPGEEEDHVDFASRKVDSGWSPDFVRGIAATIFGTTEIAFNEQSRVISFRTPSDDATINVYYTTKTIGTTLNHPSQGATQLFRRHCSSEELIQIFENPRLHTGKGYKRKREMDSSDDIVVRTQYGHGVIADQEAEARNMLLELDTEKARIVEKMQNILKKIRVVDLDREKEAARVHAKYEARKEEREKRARQIQEKLEKQQREERHLRKRTCSDCGKIFQEEHAKQQHYDAVHLIRCEFCFKEFDNNHALRQHKNALDLW